MSVRPIRTTEPYIHVYMNTTNTHRHTYDEEIGKTLRIFATD